MSRLSVIREYGNMGQFLLGQFYNYLILPLFMPPPHPPPNINGLSIRSLMNNVHALIILSVSYLNQFLSLTALLNFSSLMLWIAVNFDFTGFGV